MASINNFKTKRDNTKGNNLFDKGRNFNRNSDNVGKSERLMNGVAIWTSFYRLFPHVFVKEYLDITCSSSGFNYVIFYFTPSPIVARYNFDPTAIMKIYSSLI